MTTLSKARADQIADEWSGAYRADYNGREVSVQIIRALFEEGINKADAREIYFSKHLRWFFDGQGDNVPVKVAAERFKAYLKRNANSVKSMFKSELQRPLSVQGLGWNE
jgi:hypothetical protein